VLGLDGQGGAESFADYSQWESWQAERRESEKVRAGGNEAPRPRTAAEQPAPAKKKLGYLEAREYATIDQRIAQAEQVLQAKRAQLEDPAIASDGPRLLSAHAEMEAAQKTVDDLYARWSELEEKKD